MKVAIWLLLWLMFGTSLLGLILAAALWTKRAREIVVSMWFKAKTKEEIPDLKYEVFALYDELLRRLFYNENAIVSKSKTLYLAMISSILVAVSAPLLGNEPLALMLFGSPQNLAVWVLVFGLLSLPAHWLIEYQFAKGFTTTYAKCDAQSMRSLLLKSCAAGIGRMLLAISVLIFYTCLIFFGEATLMDSKSSSGLVILAVSPVMASGLFWFPLSLGLSFSPTYPEAPIAAVFTLLSLCVSFATSSALLIYASVSRSRTALRCLAAVCERLDALPAPAVFGFSMALFALATGCMGAFTFPTTPNP